MTTHHLAARPDTVRWGFWDGSLKPVLTINSGDTVTIDTLSGEPANLPEPVAGFTVLADHRDVLAKGPGGPGPHFLTGPVAVAGAEPGDVLEVRRPQDRFGARIGAGTCSCRCSAPCRKISRARLIHIPIDRARSVGTHAVGPGARRSSRSSAIMGVAPPPALGHGCTRSQPRAFGGNMDNKELGAGTTLYFPVFADGALFSAGDGHGVQGDGEVCLTALETALSGTFKFTCART